MKRLILSLLMVAMTALTVRAARALSIPVTVTQPDGTTLTITLHGDEHCHWTTTTDGTLVTEVNKAYYVAAVGDDGLLSATKVLAHDSQLRGSEELQVCELQQQRRQLFFNHAERVVQKARRAQVTGADYFPHTGNPKCLVILVNFSDKSFASTDPQKQFEQYFNGETQENLGHNEDRNLVGVKEYFRQSSNGKFTPEFTVVGPYTLPQKLEYYGKNTTEDIGSDANYSQFCKDAVAAAEADGVDFKAFDNGNRNVAELVCVIYAGYGESVSGNPANTLWPKCGSASITTNSGIKINYMNCSPELYRVSRGNDINGIGLFCHEFSHGMGLPDLYATEDNAKVNNQCPEFWDLMDYGEYAKNGYAPVPYAAWEREAMGWIEIEELKESQNGIELKSLAEEDGKAYKFSSSTNDEEWIVLQNVRTSNDATRTLGYSFMTQSGHLYEGHGLLAMHIAYNKHTVSMTDYPNKTKGIPRVCIVPADGLVIHGDLIGDGKPHTTSEYFSSLEGDPFPGTSNVTELTAEQNLPNYKFYNDLNDDTDDTVPVFKLLNITENTETGVVTFDFDNGTPSAIAEVKSLQSTGDGALYDLQGRKWSNGQLPKGLYIQNGKKITVR